MLGISNFRGRWFGWIVVLILVFSVYQSCAVWHGKLAGEVKEYGLEDEYITLQQFFGVKTVLLRLGFDDRSEIYKYFDKAQREALFVALDKPPKDGPRRLLWEYVYYVGSHFEAKTPADEISNDVRIYSKAAEIATKLPYLRTGDKKIDREVFRSSRNAFMFLYFRGHDFKIKQDLMKKLLMAAVHNLAKHEVNMQWSESSFSNHLVYLHTIYLMYGFMISSEESINCSDEVYEAYKVLDLELNEFPKFEKDRPLLTVIESTKLKNDEQINQACSQ